MAKKINRGLGALAALGALAYQMSRDKGERNYAPVEDRTIGQYDTAGAEGYMPSAAPVAQTSADIARFADVGTNVNEYNEPYFLTPPAGGSAIPVRSAAAPVRPAAAPSRAIQSDMAQPANFSDAAALFRAREREERGTPAMRSPNVSADTERRTGVRLSSPAGASRGVQGGPTARQIEEYANRQVTRVPMTREQMISQIPTGGYKTVDGGSRVSGNEFTRNVGNILNAPVPGMVPLGRAASAAGRAGSTSRELGYLAETPVTFLGKSGSRPVRGSERIEGGASQALLTEGQRALPSTKALPAPRGRIAGPSKAELTARDRAAREAARRDEMLRENAEAYGLNPNAPGYEAVMRALRKDLGGSDFALKKKGGMIKAKAKPKQMASGGMTSASKRADGIASKGKTKCKMY